VQQAGWAFIGGVGRAGIWGGTAESWVSLDPAHVGSNWSVANATSGTQQAGWILLFINASVQHAGIWSGTATSWVDLHPAGATESEARGTTGVNQVGWAEFAGVKRAGFWSGTPESWEDLSAVLTGSWGETRAEGIWSDGATIQVAGWGRNNTTVRDEALLWTRSIVPPCLGDANGDNLVNFSDVTAVLANFGGSGPNGDANGDNFVNFADVTAVLANFGADCN
jgi:hypothetical protein